MTKNSEVIDMETGEVLDQSSLVPMGDGSSLKELIPVNRMTNIAKSTLSRIVWDKKRAIWTCSLGEFTELTFVPKAASELFAVWTEQVGKPAYYGVSKEEASQVGEWEQGYRIAFIEQTIGPCYTDLFGLARDFGEAVCKIATNTENPVIKTKGSVTIPTPNGVFHSPKIVR